MKIQANCAARTMISDVQPIAEIQQRTGLPIECCCFIGSSPIRRYAEDWTVDHLQRCTEEAISFAIREGLTVMYVTEDTTRARSRDLAPALHHRRACRRIAHLHRRHRGTFDA